MIFSSNVSNPKQCSTSRSLVRVQQNKTVASMHVTFLSRKGSSSADTSAEDLGNTLQKKHAVPLCRQQTAMRKGWEGTCRVVSRETGCPPPGLVPWQLYNWPLKPHSTFLGSVLTGTNIRVCSGLCSAGPHGCCYCTQRQTFRLGI